MLDSITSNFWFVPVTMMVVIVALFPLLTGYIVHVERKVLADMQARLGPMRVGPYGLLQPLADALKLLLKEDTIPARADRAIFFVAPILSVFTALTAFAVIPFSETLRITDVNVGVLVVSAFSAVGILGIILGGWSSNSHYPLLGALRSSAQLVSYEIALSLALLCGVMSAETLSLVGMVKSQQERGLWFAFDNFGLMFPAFMIYLIAATAETNRAPFDLPDAESELVAGFHTEYSGFRWALFMLAEYANIFVVSSVAVAMFWGGWLRPFPGVAALSFLNIAGPLLILSGSGLWTLKLIPRLQSRAERIGLLIVALALIAAGAVFLIPAFRAAAIGPFWFLLKVSVFLYIMIWFRGTFPRYRYDQLMNIGWKYLIPIGMGAVLLNAVAGMAAR